MFLCPQVAEILALEFKTPNIIVTVLVSPASQIASLTLLRWKRNNFLRPADSPTVLCTEHIYEYFMYERGAARRYISAPKQILQSEIPAIGKDICAPCWSTSGPSHAIHISYC